MSNLEGLRAFINFLSVTCAELCIVGIGSVEIKTIYCFGLHRILQNLWENFTNTVDNTSLMRKYDLLRSGDSIIRVSGIGKSSAISRAITLITENRVIEVENPYTKIIPCICVQCPFDSLVKGVLLEILRKVDEMIGSKYYQNALRARTTTDMLIGSVSQVALNHIGLLVVDDIQNVCNSKNGCFVLP